MRASTANLKNVSFLTAETVEVDRKSTPRKTLTEIAKSAEKARVSIIEQKLTARFHANHHPEDERAWA